MSYNFSVLYSNASTVSLVGFAKNIGVSKIDPGIESSTKGPPQLKKSLKFQLLVEIFVDSLPPSLKKGSTNKNVGISYLIVIIKFVFFKISNPPPLFHQNA